MKFGKKEYIDEFVYIYANFLCKDTQEHKTTIAVGKRSYGGWGMKTGGRHFIFCPIVPVEF